MQRKGSNGANILIPNNMKKIILLITAIGLLSFIAPDKANVLIIGDSISNGYTPFVRKALTEKANIVHNPGNAANTGYGLQNIEAWLGNKKWDIIVFNWGLHDLCYRNPESKVQGNRDKVHGKITYTPGEYGKNLEKLVQRLKGTGAKLLFATTTYVPEGEAGRFVKDAEIYNNVALNIMKKNNIEVIHLYKISKKIHKKYPLAEGDVHYKPEGYELLAKPIIEILKKNL
jgi:lysophospholipase L1-like esterase